MFLRVDGCSEVAFSLWSIQNLRSTGLWFSAVVPLLALTQSLKYLMMPALCEFLSPTHFPSLSDHFFLQSIRCRAVPSEDGKHYILNGSKIWWELLNDSVWLFFSLLSWVSLICCARGELLLRASDHQPRCLDNCCPSFGFVAWWLIACMCLCQAQLCASIAGYQCALLNLLLPASSSTSKNIMYYNFVGGNLLLNMASQQLSSVLRVPGLSPACYVHPCCALFTLLSQDQQW